jgi:hypothetical protein
MRLNDREVAVYNSRLPTQPTRGDLTLFLSEELWDSYQWDYLRCVW